MRGKTVEGRYILYGDMDVYVDRGYESSQGDYLGVT